MEFPIYLIVAEMMRLIDVEVGQFGQTARGFVNPEASSEMVCQHKLHLKRTNERFIALI
jgi:hypothetical protein